MCQNCNPGSVSRRGLIAGGLALSLTASLISPVAAQEADAGAAAAPVTPEEAIQRLVDGNARYVANKPINADYSAGRASRAMGQRPFAAIVSCSDSRVAPELIFDQGPGELFVIRVAGNFISEEGLATLEFGVAVLGIKTILVLGHTACGAVVATISSIADNKLPPGHLPSLVNAIRPAVYDVMGDNPADLLVAATARNAMRNAEMALTAGPILSAAAAEGALSAKAGVYDIATGKVEFL
jgi:carbonic anhydrase